MYMYMYNKNNTTVLCQLIKQKAILLIYNYYIQYVYIQYICIYMYSLSSITAVSLYDVNPPNTIIQLVVGVTLHNERE